MSAKDDLVADLIAFMEADRDTREEAARALADVLISYQEKSFAEQGSAPIGNLYRYLIVSSSYNVKKSDNVIECAVAGITVVLPVAPGSTGEFHTVKNGSGGVVHVRSSGGMIDGEVVFDLYAGESISVVSNGSVWRVV